jgi:hypothetical protein
VFYTFLLYSETFKVATKSDTDTNNNKVYKYERYPDVCGYERTPDLYSLTQQNNTHSIYKVEYEIYGIYVPII